MGVGVLGRGKLKYQAGGCRTCCPMHEAERRGRSQDGDLMRRDAPECERRSCCKQPLKGSGQYGGRRSAKIQICAKFLNDKTCQSYGAASGASGGLRQSHRQELRETSDYSNRTHLSQQKVAMGLLPGKVLPACFRFMLAWRVEHGVQGEVSRSTRGERLVKTGVLITW